MIKVTEEMNKIRFVIQEDRLAWNDGLMQVYLYARKGSDRLIFNSETNAFEPHVISCNPPTAMILTREALFALAAALAESGFLPREMVERSGEIGAMKDHLNDMRAIAMNTIKSIPVKEKI